MKLRAVLKTLLNIVAIIVTADSTGRLVAADTDQPQYYELRIYTTKSEAQQKLISDYWQKAAVPAYNRLGIPTVGVFTELQDSATSTRFMFSFLSRLPGLTPLFPSGSRLMPRIRLPLPTT